MSKESYSIGFCKAAMANGVDPLALAEIKLSMMDKFAQFYLGTGGIGVDVTKTKDKPIEKAPAPAPAPAPAANQFGEEIGKWWNGLEPWQRSLIGVGGGALLGGAIQKLLGGEAGATGAVLGGLGGLAASDVADWKALQSAFRSEKKEPDVAESRAAKPAPKK